MSIEIIAEVAQGYAGDPTLARLLARSAVLAGADAVKFQLVYADELATPDYPYYARFQKLQMPQDAWHCVVQEVRAGKRRLYLDVFGERSLGEAKAMGADWVKIHSTDFFNDDLVREALACMSRVFVSLGGISADELEEFLHRHHLSPSDSLCLLYGFQGFPTPIDSNHLQRLGTLRVRFPGYPFGFMDHTDGSDEETMTVSLVALAYGVQCIEKHITLDRTLQLEDYISALDGEHFRHFVQRVRRLESALGTESLELSAPEWEYRRKAVKTIVAKQHLKQGDVVTRDQLCFKRAAEKGSETSIYRLDEAVGRTLVADVAPNQSLTRDMVR